MRNVRRDFSPRAPPGSRIDPEEWTPRELRHSFVNLVTQLFAIVAVLFHVVAFVLESFLFHRPNVQTFLLGRPEPSAGVRFWAFNQGFYNLFLAAGPAAGLIAQYAGNQSVGRAFVIYRPAPSWLRAASYCSFPTAGCGAA